MEQKNWPSCLLLDAYLNDPINPGFLSDLNYGLSLPVLHQIGQDWVYRYFSYDIVGTQEAYQLQPIHVITIDAKDFSVQTRSAFPGVRQALLPMVNSADLPDREEMLLMLDYLRPMYMTNRFVQRQLVRQYDQWLAALWPGELRDYYRGIAGEFIDWLESFRL